MISVISVIPPFRLLRCKFYVKDDENGAQKDLSVCAAASASQNMTCCRTMNYCAKCVLVGSFSNSDVANPYIESLIGVTAS